MVKNFGGLFNIVFEEGLLKLANILADKISTKEMAVEEKFCLGDICVSEEQFKRLLENNGIYDTKKYRMS